MIKKLSVRWLKKHGACYSGIQDFKNQEETDPIKIIKILIKNNRLDDANWLICRLFNKKQKVQYAIFAARKVLKIYEKRYPKNKISRKAIEAAENYVNNQTADAAAHAADAAADAAAYAAADAAAYAAYAAANATAYAAAYATANAACAADAAANAAANAANGVALKKKIIKYGIKLLKN